jgi:hypothetical protein
MNRTTYFRRIEQEKARTLEIIRAADPPLTVNQLQNEVDALLNKTMWIPNQISKITDRDAITMGTWSAFHEAYIAAAYPEEAKR